MAVGVGELEQQAETSGQEQQAVALEGAEGQQAQPPVAQEVFEDDQPLPENVAPKALREYGDRWKAKAGAFEQALTPLGGLEGLQELAEPLQALLNPASDGVSVLEAVSRIAPHIDAQEFVGSAIDAMPDEQAARLLQDRREDVVKMLFGDILPNVTYDDARLYLENYAPDEDPKVREQRESLQRREAEFNRAVEGANRERGQAQQAEVTRQLQEGLRGLGDEAFKTPTEYVIGKLKLAEVPPNASDSVKADFKRAADFVRYQTQLESQQNPAVAQALNLAGTTYEQAVRARAAAQQETNAQRRDALLRQAQTLESRAKRHAITAAQTVKGVATQNATWLKGLLDDRLALRASEANRATDQRVEVAGAGGGGVTSTASRGEMPPYGTPAYEKWLTDGFSP